MDAAKLYVALSKVCAVEHISRQMAINLQPAIFKKATKTKYAGDGGSANGLSSKRDVARYDKAAVFLALSGSAT